MPSVVATGGSNGKGGGLSSTGAVAASCRVSSTAVNGDNTMMESNGRAATRGCTVASLTAMHTGQPCVQMFTATNGLAFLFKCSKLRTLYQFEPFLHTASYYAIDAIDGSNHFGPCLPS